MIRKFTLRISLVAAVAALVLAWSTESMQAPVTASSSGEEMQLTVWQGGYCSGNDCYARAGETFQLSVEAVSVPAEDYIMFQAYIDFGGTYDEDASEDGAGTGTCGDGIPNGDPDGRDFHDSDCTTVPIEYVPTESAEDEVVWPDVGSGLVVRGPYTHSRVVLGAVSGFNPPVDSSYTGELLSLEFSCPEEETSATLTLEPYGASGTLTAGAVFADPDSELHTPKTNAITVTCVEATGGDYDGDGCSDATENGSDEEQGGDRNFVNPWDFYDVAGPGGADVPDGVVDQANDYMQVVAHYSPQGQSPYDAHYDRGPLTPGGSWKDTLGPDGVIDLANDILGVAQQIGHDCT